MWRVASVLLLLLCTPSVLPAPAFTLLAPQFVAGELSPPVEARLARDWESYRTNLLEPEHAYCITRYTVRRSEAAVTVRVEEVERAVEGEATPESIEYDCGLVPSLHTHPPSECLTLDERWYCTRGIELPELCLPSETDVQTALGDWHRFAVVQCAPHRFGFYVPRAILPQ